MIFISNFAALSGVSKDFRRAWRDVSGQVAPFVTLKRALCSVARWPSGAEWSTSKESLDVL